MTIVRLTEFTPEVDKLVRSNNGEVNVIVDNGNVQDADKELVFGPLQGNEVFLLVEPNTSWSHILAGLGCFPSVSQARKNGWNKTISEGFTPTFKVGKANRKFFTVWNPSS